VLIRLICLNNFPTSYTSTSVRLDCNASLAISSIAFVASSATAGQPVLALKWCIHKISTEFANSRGQWKRLCVECSFYSYTRVDQCLGAQGLYIQNEGLTEKIREITCTRFQQC
jgi:hypothetical protein